MLRPYSTGTTLVYVAVFFFASSVVQWSDVTFMAPCHQIPLPGSTRHLRVISSVAEQCHIDGGPGPVSVPNLDLDPVFVSNMDLDPVLVTNRDLKPVWIQFLFQTWMWI